MPEVGSLECKISDYPANRCQLLVRQLQKVVQEVQLIEKLQRGRMDGIAPEITEEIAMLLEHDHLHTGASQQIAQHHPCGAATDDTTRG